MRIAKVLDELGSGAPDSPAVGAAGHRLLTFGALAAQRRHVGERLTGWEMGPGDVVAAMIPSRPEMAVALLTFPGPVTFAPLGPRTDAVLAADLLTRLGARAVVLPADLDHPVADAAVRLGLARIDLVADPERPAGAFTLRLDRPVAGDISRQPEVSRYAYICATSGTTGKRKLAPFTHERVLRHAAAFKNWFRLGGRDAALHTMPLHMTHGLYSGLLGPVLAGGAVHLCEETDPEHFLAVFETVQPTWFTAGFTFHREILRRSAERGGAPRSHRLRFARAGSGVLEPEEISAFGQYFGAPLLAGLSTTETLLVAQEPIDRTVHRRGTVGLPVGNEVALMDESAARPPIGAPGEIVVRGPMVFDGYLDDPALTAQSFHEEWYRTGDLGRFDADGYLYIAGRIKEIISRGGEKISPVEVEAAVTHTPGVREAAAFGVPHPTLGEELGIAAVREPGATESDDEIVARLRSRLTAWQVRPRIFFCERLPRTETGKMLRRMLAEFCLATGCEFRKARRAPSTPFEHALCGLWSAVLGVPEPGVDDDFFALGGDSLRGASLLGQVTGIFGVSIRLSQLFADAGTIAGMARLVAAQAHTGG